MDENLGNALEESIRALRAGDSAAACLARYPEYDEELAPLLRAAQELDVVTGWELPPESWARHRSQISAAMAAQQASRPWWAGLLGTVTAGPAGTLAAGAAGLLMFVFLAVTSQPGHLSYRWNLLYQQVPIWLEPDKATRSVTELLYADQRLADIRTQFTAAGGVDEAALQSLLDADEVAAQDSAGRGRQLANDTAAWIEQHARTLYEFSSAASGGDASQILERAAAQLLEHAALARTAGGSR